MIENLRASLDDDLERVFAPLKIWDQDFDLASWRLQPDLANGFGKYFRGADIVVGTPGRICDLMSTRQLLIDQCQYFVLDEADRMLDLGFMPDIRKVVAALPNRRTSAALAPAWKPAMVGAGGRVATGVLSGMSYAVWSPISSASAGMRARIRLAAARTDPNTVRGTGVAGGAPAM